jgi:superfamily II DNA/RNA helicase
MMFGDLNIEREVLASLNEIGFNEPTRIQYETIPLIKEGYDVIGQSETGSGKTAAFGIPLVEKVTRGTPVQGLILAPTRELALQNAGELRKFSRAKGLRIECVYGGVSMEPQISGLRRSEIVVGTPGRIMDHMRRGTLKLNNVKIFVLDEADRMIDMGFIEDIETIVRSLPRERQTLLFSATMPYELKSIRDRFTKNPREVVTDTKVKEEYLKQYYCDVDRKIKFSVLVYLLRKEAPRLAMIFCNSRRDVDNVARNLRDNGVNATALHGGLSQQRREQIVEEFHRGSTRILVATDVAARGLDFKDVTHIFNYSVPVNPEDYVNRIGRTARAGQSGKAIVLLTRDDFDSFSRIVNTFSFDIQQIDYSADDIRMLPFRRGEFQGHTDRRGQFRREDREFRRHRTFERRPRGFVFT